MYIKICGITRESDRDIAIENGASALGFIAYPKSPRYVSPERVKELLKGIPSAIDTVAVFVNATVDEMLSYVEAGIKIVQLHGAESADVAREMAPHAIVWKAMAIRSLEDIDLYREYPAERYLIDAYCPDDHGGTGKLADWDLAELAVQQFDVPVMLAGGLKADNVADAVSKVKPFGLDLSSGVEVSPGVKDHALIELFMKEIAGVLRS